MKEEESGSVRFVFVMNWNRNDRDRLKRVDRENQSKG
jgi:hypothetical protein